MNDSHKTIGAAVVGLGVGEQHAREYSRNHNCHLKFICDLDKNKANYLSNILKCQVAENYDEIVQDSDIDIISIASFDDAHYEQVISGLNSGKHLFVEKPLCNTLDELKEIKRLWLNNKGSLKLSTNFVLRVADLYIWLKEQIKSGEFGDIYAIDGDYLYGRLHKITHGWRNSAKNFSAMKGGGVHMVDLMMWLTDQRPFSVLTIGNQICTKNMKFDFCDFMSSLFRFESGLVGRITANLGCVHRHQHCIKIFGTKKTFIYDDMGPRMHFTRDPHLQSTPVFIDTLPKRKSDLITFFVDSVLEKCNLNEHTQNIFDVISTCTACDKSLQLKKEVQIDYV